jgi:4-amino-4-deoxy-L-arabinose transferase-like glycosyltransferase
MLLLGLAAIPRLALWTMSLHHPERAFWPDARTYLDVALHLLHTGAYPADTALRTPVFPTFIALVYWIAGERPWAFILAQVGISVLSVALTWWLGRWLVSRQAALLGALLMALSLDSITLSFQMLSETTFTFLLLLTLWCWVRFRDSQRPLLLVLSALLMGLVILCRPIAVFFPVLLAGTLLVPPRPMATAVARQILVFGAAVVLAVTPWIWHNARGIGVRTLSTVSAQNLLYYYAATVEADVRGLPDEQVRSEFNGRVERRLRELGLANTEANRTRVYTGLALPIVTAHPLRFVALNLRADLRGLVPDVATPGDIVGVTTGDKGTLAVLRRDGVAAATAHFFRGQSWLIWVILPFVALLFVTYLAAIAGVVTLARARDWYALAILLLPVVYYLVLPGAASTARFKMPTLPYLSLLAGIGLHAAWSSRAARGKPAMASAASVSSAEALR